MAPICETVRLLKATLPEDVAPVGYAGAPWTIATYMVEGRGGGAFEHATIKQWALSDPDGFQPLIDLLVRAAIDFLDRQIEACAEAIQLFESWAGILPQPFFDRWCFRPVRSIVSAVKAKHPHIPVIAFPRGAGLLYRGYMEATQADCLGLDSTVPLDWAAESIQRRLGRCIQGNLDPQLLVAGGAAMRAETERLLRAMSTGPFVFNLGHGIVKATPPAHVDALVRQVHSWSRQPPLLPTCRTRQDAILLTNDRRWHAPALLVAAGECPKLETKAAGTAVGSLERQVSGPKLIRLRSPACHRR